VARVFAGRLRVLIYIAWLACGLPFDGGGLGLLDTSKAHLKLSSASLWAATRWAGGPDLLLESLVLRRVMWIYNVAQIRRAAMSQPKPAQRVHFSSSFHFGADDWLHTNALTLHFNSMISDRSGR
jgi:hypothetical protein